MENKQNENKKEKYTIEMEDIYFGPCDCGHRIRHNNGGNYHKVIQLIKINGIPVGVRETDTREINRNDKRELFFIDSRNPEQGFIFLNKLKPIDKIYTLYNNRFDLHL